MKTAPRKGLQTTIDEADLKIAGPSAVVAAEKGDPALTSPLHGKKRRHSPSSGGFKRRKIDDALIGDDIRALDQQTQDGERKRPLDPAVLEEIANRCISTDNEHGSDEEDAEPWEIFDYLPSTEDTDLGDRHALSSALMHWNFEKVSLKMLQRILDFCVIIVFLYRNFKSSLPRPRTRSCLRDASRISKGLARKPLRPSDVSRT